MIAAPWAVDSGGRSVATRFEIRDSTLIQHVDHRGARYPVIADPLWVVPVVVVGARVALRITVKAATKKGAKSAAKKAAQASGKKVKKVKKPKRIRYRSFTRANFRHNLYVCTELHLVGCDAHHTMPVKFEKQFRRAGINIHHPKWGRWWISVPGLENNHASMARRYNRHWERCFAKLADRGLDVTKKRVLEKRTALDRKYSQYYRC